MATTLAALSSDVLGPILDLVDSISLMRLLLLGNTVLNNKLYASVRRFDHAVVRTKPRAVWPKILARFRALTHVSVSKNSRMHYLQYLVIHEVDLMALPATLRVLELDFSNALLCLLETLPPASNGASFTPRLRPDLKPKFKHLERLTWSSYTTIWVLNWDIFPLIEDLCRWPLVMAHWPCNLPLHRSLELPATTSSLFVDSTTLEKPLQKSMPPALTQLEVRGTLPPQHNLLQHLPSTLRELVLYVPTHDEKRNLEVWKPLAFLNHLTKLWVNPTNYSVDFVSLLPRSLTKLISQSVEFEVECLAFFPPSLTWIEVDFHIVSRASNPRAKVYFQEYDDWSTELFGLPDEFIPCMRELIGKMPKRLDTISTPIFAMIRPRDWEILPSEHLRQTVSSEAETILTTFHEPYLDHLPQHITDLTIPFGCTLEMARKLPPNLRRLHLYLGVDFLNDDADSESIEALEAAKAHNIAIFEALSMRTRRLIDLSLDVDYTFDFDHLCGVTIPLKNLRVVEGSEEFPEPYVLFAEEERPQLSRDLVRCLGSLEQLVISIQTLQRLQGTLPSLFQLCSELKDLTIEDLIPNGLLPLLPRKLRSLSARLVELDSSSISAIPRTLEDVKLAGEQSRWRWQDLLHLPPNVRHVRLPEPTCEGDQEESSGIPKAGPREYNRQEAVAQISKALRNEVLFEIGSKPGYDTTPHSFMELLAVERQARDIASALTAKIS